MAGPNWVQLKGSIMNDPRDKPLRASVRNGVLVVEIGVDALAERYEERTKDIEKSNRSSRRIKVTNPMRFAEDVAEILNKTDDHKASKLGDLIELACEDVEAQIGSPIDIYDEGD